MSVKKNIAYNIALSVSQLLFPLFTFPYITRVIGPDKLGSINFTQSFVQYFITFSLLGINIYGQRRVAISKHNSDELNKTFSDIFITHLLLTLSALSVYLIITNTVTRLTYEKELFQIAGFYLLFNLFSLEWFFIGMEDFKYITIRTIIIKALSVVAIFLFIKTERDYILYYLINVLSFIIPFIVNLFYLSRFIRFKNLSSFMSIKDTLKGLRHSSLYMILTNVYTLLPIIFLGFIQNDNAVGNYTVADKIYKLCITVFTAVSAVMLPRMSSLFSKGESQSFESNIQKTIDLFLSLSMLIAIALFVFSDELITIFSGNKFVASGLILRILSPLVIVIALAQIFVVQVLLPINKDKVVLKITLFSSLTCVVLNVILVWKFTYIGTAISVVISETLVSLISFLVVRSLYPKLRIRYQYLLYGILILVLVYTMHSLLYLFQMNSYFVFVAPLIVYFSLCILYVKFTHPELLRIK